MTTDTMPPGRHIVISGGSRGLGKAIVKGLLDAGYSVSTFSRNKTDFVEQLRENEKFHFGIADLVDGSSTSAFLKSSEKKFGVPYGLINCAAIAADGLLATMPEEKIEALVAVNVAGTLKFTRLAVRRMLLGKAGGVILNISTISAVRGFRGLAAYAFTKGGINSFTRALARELGDHKIRVNSVAPGYYDTEMSHSLSEEHKRQILRRTPLARTRSPGGCCGAGFVFVVRSGKLHYRSNIDRRWWEHRLGFIKIAPASKLEYSKWIYMWGCNARKESLAMVGVRPFVEADAPPVADLVWKVLHERQGTSPPSMKQYFSELFLRNPWRDDGIASHVYEDAQGKIVGFFGAVPRRMSFQGKTIRLAFGSNFVMEPGSRASMAAIQLIRAFLKGTQDISITNSANENSKRLLRSLGFTVVPAYSLLWARPLRPSLYALSGIARLKKSRLAANVGTIIKPFCRMVDALATKVSLSPLYQVHPETTAEELGTETLLELLANIPAKHWMLPEYDKRSIDWVLDFVGRRKAFGDLRRVVVRDHERKPIGWYIYYVSPGGIGETLQIGSETASVSKVLDHLFYEAWQKGLIGLHGRLEPQFMQELTMKSCFSLRNGSWTLAHSSRLVFLNLLAKRHHFFSRLDGEWALRPGPSDLKPAGWKEGSASGEFHSFVG